MRIRVRPSPEFIASLCPSGEFLGVKMQSTTFAEDLARANARFWRDVDALEPLEEIAAVKFGRKGDEQ